VIGAAVHLEKKHIDQMIDALGKALKACNSFRRPRSPSRDPVSERWDPGFAGNDTTERTHA
jgi:hypothetical protein